MPLADEIKKIRESHRLSKAQFAKKLGLSPMYATLLENPRRHYVPSEKVVRQIAGKFSFGEEERIITERKLLLELARLKAPREIASFYDDIDKEERLYYGESMPLVFIERLRRDVGNIEISDNGTIQKILKKTGISEGEMEAIIQGKYTINRQKVIMLALELKQPVEEYLLLADYLPDNLKNLSKNKKWTTMLRSIGDLPPETVNRMIDVIQDILDMYKEGRRLHHERK